MIFARYESLCASFLGGGELVLANGEDEGVGEVDLCGLGGCGEEL